MTKNGQFQTIVNTIEQKASLKQKIYRNTLIAFSKLKECTKEIISDLQEKATQFDQGVSITFVEKGEFEFQLKIGGDVIVFIMHTNVFDFDKSHHIWKTAYVKEDQNRSYCGNINVYNFLADSFKYHRFDDIGYLIARMFINSENHFFVEGRRQLNFMHNDFVNQTLDELCVRNIIQQAIIYSMDFDLYSPPFNHVQEISVGHLLTETSGMHLKTGKRVGYKFSFED
ncbi:MAG: hypothetical protein CMO34_01760 [Verrucomicrobia bacterium]|nr:hypothetical protein [Verrucomicrobiota bacterium]|tara:strand:- start:799 stop:1479 length:681 start_codon:yes stop_codon:yes gene_type:complete